MDANDEGAEPEPVPGAPEGAAPGGVASESAAPDGTTGSTSPDESAADDLATDDPRSEGVASPVSERTEPQAVAAAESEPEESEPEETDPERTDPEGSGLETVAPVESEGDEPLAVAPAEPRGTGPEAVVPAEPERDEPPAVAPVEIEETQSEAVPWPGSEVPVGLAALSLRYQIAAALALAVVAVASCVHLGMVFLHVAPSNTVTKQHGRAIDEWIYPEFEQNWKLFAPNPLQQDIAVQVRALVRTADGTSRETGWYDLSALDGVAIDGNPLPSHTQQNELRRAWDFYAGTHDGENRPVGLRGDLSESYLRRIGVLRLDREHAGGEGAVIERVQFRSLTTDVPPPAWSDEKVSGRPVVRELPWWAVPESDRADGLTEASAR
ncbi:DUF5819 family protein [Streptomyces rhizosphaerihabitans]|uniref:DUF5819 family protein n=1 Tax=Streptomyces rhizosphaerihabitans TaxID=1266770 RepID=UPI0028F74280|nr:DUF5819 family protein [Streptomyces rhizosphaerihabitans]